MPGVTSVYGLPFLEPSDPPDIAGATEDLAQAVDDELVLRSPLGTTAVLSSLSTLTTAVTDLPGCVVNVTTPRPGAVALLTWTGDCVLTIAGTASLLAVVNVMVDGVDVAFPQGVWGPGNQVAGANTRGPASNSTTVVLPSAGSHTFKLRGAVSSATGQIKLNAQHTQLSALILP